MAILLCSMMCLELVASPESWILGVLELCKSEMQDLLLDLLLEVGMCSVGGGEKEFLEDYCFL